MSTRVKALAPLVLILCLDACQIGNHSQPVPSVSQIGSDLHCPTGDGGYEDQQAGWGFCYPGTWKYLLGSQGLQSPAPELDLVFDIYNDTCITPSAAPGGPTPPKVCPTDANLFAVMIVSTYERGAAPDLASWVQANLKPAPALEPIQWGNAVEAAKLTSPDVDKRIALTQHHVVILDLRSGPGLLDLETPMSARLSTWKFTY